MVDTYAKLGCLIAFALLCGCHTSSAGEPTDDMIKLAFDRLERLFDRVRRG